MQLGNGADKNDKIVEAAGDMKIREKSDDEAKERAEGINNEIHDEDYDSDEVVKSTVKPRVLEKANRRGVGRTQKNAPEIKGKKEELKRRNKIKDRATESKGNGKEASAEAKEKANFSDDSYRSYDETSEGQNIQFDDDDNSDEDDLWIIQRNNQKNSSSGTGESQTDIVGKDDEKRKSRDSTTLRNIAVRTVESKKKSKHAANAEPKREKRKGDAPAQPKTKKLKRIPYVIQNPTRKKEVIKQSEYKYKQRSALNKKATSTSTAPNMADSIPELWNTAFQLLPKQLWKKCRDNMETLGLNRELGLVEHVKITDFTDMMDKDLAGKFIQKLMESRESFCLSKMKA